MGCGILVDDRAGDFSVEDFAFGRVTRKAVRPARCASRVTVPRRLDRSRAKRRLRVRLRLTQRTKVTARAKRRRGITFRRSRTLRAGNRSITVRLRAARASPATG